MYQALLPPWRRFMKRIGLFHISGLGVSQQQVMFVQHRKDSVTNPMSSAQKRFCVNSSSLLHLCLECVPLPLLLDNRQAQITCSKWQSKKKIGWFWDRLMSTSSLTDVARIKIKESYICLQSPSQRFEKNKQIEKVLVFPKLLVNC